MLLASRRSIATGMVRLLLVIDELGQFVADSGPRILDIQSFAEEIATYGKGKVWLVTTSHESMHDVVKNARVPG